MASDKIFVKWGRVFSVEHPTEDDSVTITIQRVKDGFLSDMGDPDVQPVKGSLEELIAEFDASTQELYRKLFALQEASWNAIRSIGAAGTIEFLPSN